MSKKSDLALEEMEEIEAAPKDKQLLELVVHYTIIFSGEYAAELSIKGQEETCVVKFKACLPLLQLCHLPVAIFTTLPLATFTTLPRCF